MTPMTIGSLTPTQQKADVTAPSGPTAEQKKAARDFEAIFMRQLLASLEKSSGISGGESSGGAVFRSMMVGALADTAAEGGGIGMSELILKAMMPPLPQGKPDLSHQDLRDPTYQMGALSTAALSIGALPSGALPSGTLPSGAGPARSTRLGVTSHVLTEARPATILGGHQLAAPMPPLSKGGVR